MKIYFFVSKNNYNDIITIYYSDDKHDTEKMTFTGYTVKQAIKRMREVFGLKNKHVIIIGGGQA